MKREDFLKRVRDAASQGRAYRVHPTAYAETAGYVGAGDDPPAKLAAEVNAVGGFAFIVEGYEQARHKAAELLDKHVPQRALCWEHPVLEKLGLAALLSDRNVEHWHYGRLASLTTEEQRAAMLGVDVCISSVSYAIAETGTLAVMSQPGQERGGSLLGPVHLAVVETSQILPDLFDLFEKLGQRKEGMPSNLTLITGPSKTGDIELELTTGVHGPGVWYVLIIKV